MSDPETARRTELDEPPEPQDPARRRAIERIEHKRKFWGQTAISGLAVLLLAAIWAISEFHNAGGWPTQGFSQSSGIPNVWNIWIIYPVMAWVFITVIRYWSLFQHKPISEEEIRREMKRQSGSRDRAA
jgi:2TM domain-containing protein